MKQAICSFIYHKILGWKAEVSVPDFDKCIICAAPHTTNWDLFIGKLFISAIGRESGFMMKKEWFFFPLGILFRWMGGIPVHRDKRTSMVDQVIKQVNASEKFRPSSFPMRTGNRRERQKSPSPGRNPRRNSFRKQRTAASVFLPIIFTCLWHGERTTPRTPRRKPFIPGLWKPYRSKTKWNICWMCCCSGKQRKKRL